MGGVDSRSTDLQFNNPEAPNYDWQQDREWFNQRLANARLHNSALERKIASLRAALTAITNLEAGSRGAYGKFKEAQNLAMEALKP